MSLRHPESPAEERETQEATDLSIEVGRVQMKVVAARDAAGRSERGRQLAVAVTKLEEARLWLAFQVIP